MRTETRQMLDRHPDLFDVGFLLRAAGLPDEVGEGGKDVVASAVDCTLDFRLQPGVDWEQSKWMLGEQEIRRVLRAVGAANPGSHPSVRRLCDDLNLWSADYPETLSADSLADQVSQVAVWAIRNLIDAILHCLELADERDQITRDLPRTRISYGGEPTLEQHGAVGTRELAPALTATELAEAFRSSVVEVDVDGRWISVPSGTGSKRPWPWDKPLWVITAHNPGGRLCSESWNMKADRELRRHLDTAAIQYLEALGRSKDSSWQEASVALLGATERAAIDIGHQFGQLAIFKVHNWRRTVVGTGIEILADPKPPSGMTVPMAEALFCECGHREDDHGYETVDEFDLWHCNARSCGCEEFEYVDGPRSMPCLVCKDGLFLHGDGEDECRACGCAEFYDGPGCAFCGKRPLDHLVFEDMENDRKSCNAYVARSDAVNLNTDSAEQLMTLPGISRKAALAIIQRRPLRVPGYVVARPFGWAALNKAVASGRVAF